MRRGAKTTLPGFPISSVLDRVVGCCGCVRYGRKGGCSFGPAVRIESKKLFTNVPSIGVGVMGLLEDPIVQGKVRYSTVRTTRTTFRAGTSTVLLLRHERNSVGNPHFLRYCSPFRNTLQYGTLRTRQTQSCRVTRQQPGMNYALRVRVRTSTSSTITTYCTRVSNRRSRYVARRNESINQTPSKKVSRLCF